MFPAPLLQRASALGEAAKRKGVTIATAESCTGGLLAGLLTAVPGSSAFFERGFVTYSNAAKSEQIGVPADLIGRHGAVSAPCALAMAEGALGRSRATVAVSVTGIAGPDGGSADKPVGLVHFGVVRAGTEPNAVACRFGPLGRDAVRMAAVEQALALLETAVAG